MAKPDLAKTGSIASPKLPFSSISFRWRVLLSWPRRRVRQRLRVLFLSVPYEVIWALTLSNNGQDRNHHPQPPRHRTCLMRRVNGCRNWLGAIQKRFYIPEINGELHTVCESLHCKLLGGAAMIACGLSLGTRLRGVRSGNSWVQSLQMPWWCIVETLFTTMLTSTWFWDAQTRRTGYQQEEHDTLVPEC